MTLCAASTLVASSNRVGRSQDDRRDRSPNHGVVCMQGNHGVVCMQGIHGVVCMQGIGSKGSVR